MTIYFIIFLLDIAFRPIPVTHNFITRIPKLNPHLSAPSVSPHLKPPQLFHGAEIRTLLNISSFVSFIFLLFAKPISVADSDYGSKALIT